jgi:hypothetical protein
VAERASVSTPKLHGHRARRPSSRRAQARSEREEVSLCFASPGLADTGASCRCPPTRNSVGAGNRASVSRATTERRLARSGKLSGVTVRSRRPMLEEVVMDQVCLWCRFRPERGTMRAHSCANSRSRERTLTLSPNSGSGSTRRSGFSRERRLSDLLVSYMESPDFANALRLFSASQDEFDLWFKRRFRRLDRTRFEQPSRDGAAGGTDIEPGDETRTHA